MRVAEKPVRQVELDTTSIRARPGARINNDDAQVIAPALFDFVARDGCVTAEAVVSAAADPVSPLHRFFEWDDAAAAHQQRLSTARMLARAVVYRVRAVGGGAVVNYQPALVRLTETMDDGTERTGYVSFTRAVADEDLRKQMVQRAANDLQQWIDRYRTVSALAGAMPAAERLLNKVTKAA